MALHYLFTTRFLKGYLTLPLLLCTLNTYAQQNSPTDTTGTWYAEELSRSFSAQNELFLEKLKTVGAEKKLLKHYQSNYKTIFKAVNEDIKDRQMMDIPSISAALAKMLHEIQENNATVPKDLRVMILREDQPNAYTMGDNTLFVTLGLFRYMENEDQVASVLSHEIGHLVMRHTLKALKYNYDNDKNSADDVKAIRHSETGKHDRAFDLLKNTVYKEGEMKREFEKQADSAGYMIFRNTRYQKNAFIDALEIMAQYDTLRPDGLAIESYKLFFDLPEQKFNEAWLKMEDFSSYNYDAFKEKFDKDSTMTHPKGDERTEHLKRLFPELARETTAERTVRSDTFNEIRIAAKNERLPNLFFKEQYGAVIYLALLQLQKEPNDPGYRKWLGKGFQKIYEARKDYQLNKYLDRIAPKEQTESYIQFLSFMWNLKLDEIKKIADFYAQRS